jgi:phage terminase large subunit GpA-like protein
VFYEQLASERRVVRYKRGQPTRRFERIVGKRAEGLDCLCYCFAARSAAPVQLDQREMELRSPVPTTARRPTIIPSKWMER